MADEWHGPAGWEDPAPRRYGPVSRVAAVSDVHANVAALTAVLADIEAADVELIVSCGDLTWGSYPDETIAAMRGLGDRALFVRGNGERAVLEISEERRRAGSPRESWRTLYYANLTANFASEVLGEIEGNEGNFDDGLWVQEVINAVEISHHERRWVSLPIPAPYAATEL